MNVFKVLILVLMDNQVTFEEISLLPLLEKVLILVLMDNQVTCGYL